MSRVRIRPSSSLIVRDAALGHVERFLIADRAGGVLEEQPHFLVVIHSMKSRYIFMPSPWKPRSLGEADVVKVAEHSRSRRRAG